MTHPTGMDLVDHFLAPVHGRGIYHRRTSGTDLNHPHASTIFSSMVWHSLRGCHCPTSPTLSLVSFPPPCLAFSHETLQEKALCGFVPACTQGSITQRSSCAITHGADLPPTIGFPMLQGWLSSRALLSRPPPYFPTSRYSTADRISIQEGAIKASSNNAFRH
jgi:hypothetical protein